MHHFPRQRSQNPSRANASKATNHSEGSHGNSIPGCPVELDCDWSVLASSSAADAAQQRASSNAPAPADPRPTRKSSARTTPRRSKRSRNRSSSFQGKENSTRRRHQLASCCEFARSPCADHWQAGDARRTLETLTTIAALPEQGRSALASVDRLENQHAELEEKGRHGDAERVVREMVAILERGRVQPIREPRLAITSSATTFRTSADTLRQKRFTERHSPSASRQWGPFILTPRPVTTTSRTACIARTTTPCRNVSPQGSDHLGRHFRPERSQDGRRLHQPGHHP